MTTTPSTSTAATEPVTAPAISRATWKGAITFALVSVPVRVYTATQDNDVSFKQVHPHDGDEPGLVKQRRVCATCGEEVPYPDIAKGYPHGDGFVVLTDDEIAAIPLDTTRAITVHEFVPATAVDPILHEKTYFLTPDTDAARKAYALLRDAITDAGRVAIVKVTLRQREQVAMLHARDGGTGTAVLALTTLRWADEVRHATLPILDGLPASTAAELAMAATLIDSLSSDTFDPTAYTDGYRQALQQLVDAKLAGTTPSSTEDREPAPVIDLMAALRASVEQAQARQAQARRVQAAAA